MCVSVKDMRHAWHITGTYSTFTDRRVPKAMPIHLSKAHSSPQQLLVGGPGFGED